MALTVEQKDAIREHYSNVYMGQPPKWEREERHVFLLCFEYGDGPQVIEAVLLGSDGSAHAQMIYSQQDEARFGREHFIQQAVASCWRYAEGHAVLLDTEEEDGIRFRYLATPNGLIVDARALDIWRGGAGVPIQYVQAGVPGTFEELSQEQRAEVKAGLRLALAARLEKNRNERAQRQP